MLISHEWLRTFVPHSLSPDALRELLSAHVATVDGVERLRSDLAAIVVGRVVEAGRHPNSDHLWVTKVDDGSGQLLDVVCGAPNVSVGTLYPFARTGTTLPGGLTIEKRKIRGETSNGMLCSARELGLGEEHEGILALELDVAPGTSFLAAMPVGDVRYDLDVLPNRPDLLSHLGVAREVSALTGVALGDPVEAFGAGATAPPSVGGVHAGRASGSLPVVDEAAPEVVYRAENGGAEPATVVLEDIEGCPRYMAVAIRGVTVGPSPDWLVRRLDAVGHRSISNVVDVTNYMLHGYGQPMHAFDLGKLARATLVIRRAREGERLVTLDGVTRTLGTETTVIADAERAVAIAGVMGGRDSEVTATTTDLLLEVAYFAPTRVRAARRSLGLSTDASYRYERGIDPELAPRALALAAQLITRIAGGRVDGHPMDVGAPPPRAGVVQLLPGRVERLLGDRVSAE
jgi:phenylalanyl-tRNA synthetase beta chain